MSKDWFSLVEGKAVLPWREWRACLEDPEDLEASQRLGVKAFRTFQGARTAEVRRSDEKLMEAFAHVLHHGMDELDEGLLTQMIKSLEGREGTVEPRFWESPQHRLNAYRALTSRQNAKLGPTFVFLALQDDLDQVLRLNLLRVNWFLALGAGIVTPYAKSQVDAKGRALSFSHALQSMGGLLSKGLPDFLERGEARALEQLLKKVSEIGGPELSPDGLLDLGRGADLGTDAEGDLVVYWTSGKEDRLEKRRLRSWYEDCFLLGSQLLAFKVMMLAHIASRAGGLSPNSVLL
ncbi:MAG: hypothetical protein QW520_07665 [Methanomassiliicoccales archaeon]